MPLELPPKFAEELEKPNPRPFAILEVQSRGKYDEKTSETDWGGNIGEENVDYTPSPPISGEVVLAHAASGARQGGLYFAEADSDESSDVRSYPSSAARWEGVDEDPHDGDNTYVRFMEKGQYFDLSVDGPRLLATIPANASEIVDVGLFAVSKVESPFPTYNNRLRLTVSGSLNKSSEATPLEGTYSTQYYYWTVNPYTGVAWTRDTILDIEQIGFECVGGSFSTYKRITQLYLVIDYRLFEGSGLIRTVYSLAGANQAHPLRVTIGERIPIGQGLAHELYYGIKRVHPSWLKDVTANGYDLTEGTSDYYDNDSSPSLLSPGCGNAYHKTTGDHSHIDGGLYRNDSDLDDWWGSGAGVAPRDITFTYWIFPDAGDSWEAPDAVLSLLDDNQWGGGYYYLHIPGYYDSSGNFRGYTRAKTGTTYNSVASGSPPTGEWTMVYFRCRTNGSHYDIQIGLRVPTVGSVDGTVVSIPIADFEDFVADLLHFGAWNAGSCILHNIEQLAVWNKYLSDSEITSLYNSGSGRVLAPSDESDLLALYFAEIVPPDSVVIEDGSEVPLNGHEDFSVETVFSSNGNDTPILDSIRLEVPDRIYRYTSFPSSIFNAYPGLIGIPGRVIEINLKEFVTLGYDLKARIILNEFTRQMLRENYFYNLHTSLRIGAYRDDMTEEDLHFMVQGKVAGYSLSEDEISIKIKDGMKDLSTKWPQGSGPDTAPARDEDGIHMVDVILSIIEDLGVLGRYIDRASLATLKANVGDGSPASGVFVVYRGPSPPVASGSTRIEEPEQAKKVIGELLEHLGAYQVVQENGKITFVEYDPTIAAIGDPWTRNDFEPGSVSYDPDVSNLQNVTYVFLDWNGESEDAKNFSSVIIHPDTVSISNWGEMAIRIIKSKWLAGSAVDGYYGTEIATHIAERETNRRKNGLGVLECRTRLSEFALQVGDFKEIDLSDLIINPDVGEGDIRKFMILKKDPDWKGGTISWKLMEAR